MEIKVKKSINKVCFYNENNEKIFTITLSLLNLNTLEVKDMNHHLIYVNKFEDQISILENNKVLASAKFIYDNQTILSSKRKPPRVKSLQLQSYLLIQSKQRMIEVYNKNNNLVAQLLGILDHKGRIKIFDNSISNLMIVSLYAVGYLMIHDDDIDIV